MTMNLDDRLEEGYKRRWKEKSEKNVEYSRPASLEMHDCRNFYYHTTHFDERFRPLRHLYKITVL